MNERRRLATLLLGVAGVLIGHGVTYQVLDVTLRSPHGYIGRVAQVLLPAGLGAASLLTLRVARSVNLSRRETNFVYLAVLQVGLFLGQELVEAALSSGGIGQLLPSVIMVGVASQLLVATALYWAIGSAARIVAHLATAAVRCRQDVVSGHLRWAAETTAERIVGSDIKTRGPPSLFGI